MADPQSHIEVELLDAHGQSEGVFSPKHGQSFAEAAEDAGLSLSTACCA
jgi:hypothetical protein